jgi:hypothetical protein
MSQPFFGPTQLPLDLWHVKTTNVFEFDALEQIPHPFLRIQFRSVGRQAFKMKAFGSAFGQKVFHCPDLDEWWLRPRSPTSSQRSRG